MKKFILLLTAILAVAPLYAQNREVKASAAEAWAQKHECYTPSFEADGSDAEVRNVILMIGDGMGLGTISAAMYANGGSLTMTNLKTMGYVRTQCLDDFTTDSAASGTAYATGSKTNRGYLGIGADNEVLVNLPEKLSPMGYACGVLSTDNLNGATPASFFAHQKSRNSTNEIWADLPGSCLIFASAGTTKVFDGLPLTIQEAILKEFEVVYSPESEKVAESGRLLYLPESVHADRGDYLPATTELAIEYLSERSETGFFLMIEGARIDKEAHGNNFQGMLNETLDFDKAVEAAVRFAEKDGHTLVIISADHETGAVSLGKCDPEEGFASVTYASKSHSPVMVPLFAYGPGSQAFMGVQENSDVSNKIYAILAK